MIIIAIFLMLVYYSTGYRILLIRHDNPKPWIGAIANLSFTCVLAISACIIYDLLPDFGALNQGQTLDDVLSRVSWHAQAAAAITLTGLSALHLIKCIQILISASKTRTVTTATTSGEC